MFLVAASSTCALLVVPMQFIQLCVEQLYFCAHKHNFTIVNYNDNENDFMSSQNSTVCSVDLTIKILQKRTYKTV